MPYEYWIQNATDRKGYVCEQGELPYEVAQKLLDGYEFKPELTFKSIDGQILLSLNGSIALHNSRDYMRIINETYATCKVDAYGRFLDQGRYDLCFSYDGICLSERSRPSR